MNINDSGPPRSALSELLRQPRTPADWGQSFTLWVHDDHVSNAELILNPELFKDCAPGDCLALRDSSTGKRIVVMASIVDHSIFRQKSFQVLKPLPKAFLLNLTSTRYHCIELLPGLLNFILVRKSMLESWPRKNGLLSKKYWWYFAINT